MRIYYSTKIRGELVLLVDSKIVQVINISSDIAEGTNVAYDINSMLVYEALDDIKLKNLKGNVTVLNENIVVGFDRVLNESELKELEERFNEFVFYINKSYPNTNPLVKESRLYRSSQFSISAYGWLVLNKITKGKIINYLIKQMIERILKRG